MRVRSETCRSVDSPQAGFNFVNSIELLTVLPVTVVARNGKLLETLETLIQRSGILHLFAEIHRLPSNGTVFDQPVRDTLIVWCRHMVLAVVFATCQTQKRQAAGTTS